MKIEKIVIENINSIEKAEIDFTNGVLAKEPLFLITGETGSGKSTILDAITLALYDKSSRYENTDNKEKTENGIANMQSTTNVLRKGTFDGKAEVWFSVKNKTYIATWQIHRTRNGKYDSANRRKLEVVNGMNRMVLETKVKEVAQQVTSIVGLTYEQFVRSVMLAQGHFNTFLTSDKAKQTEILEKLTGTEIYSKIAGMVGKRKNAAKSEVDKTIELYNSQTKNILSDDELATLNEELSRNQEILEKNEKETKIFEAKIRDLNKLEEINRFIDSSRSQLSDLQASYKKMLEDRQVLMLKREELKKKIDEQSGNKSIKEQMPLIVSLLESSNGSALKYDGNYPMLSEISKMLSQAETAKKECTASFDECTARLEKADLEGLLKQYDEHNKKLTVQETRKTKYLRVKQILNDYINKTQIIENKYIELDDLNKRFNICEDDFLKTKNAFEAKDSEYQVQKTMVADFMKSLRSKLEDGKPCPLCGSTDHQYHDEQVVDSLFAAIEKAWNEARTDFEKAKDAKNKTESERNLLKKSIDNEKKLLENLKTNLAAECQGRPVYDMEILDRGLNDCVSNIYNEKSKISEINSKIKDAKDIQDEQKQLQKQKNLAEERYNTILGKMALIWKKLNDDYSKVDAEIVKIDEIVNGIKRIEGFERIAEFEGKTATRNDIGKDAIIIDFTRVLTNLINKSDEKKTIEKSMADTKEENNVQDVEKSLAMLNEQKKAINLILTDIKTKLSMNIQNSAAADAVKADLQAKSGVLALWTQLANAIGTTDTDNFRDVAQAYTMRILLDQANFFLRQLSQRYELTCYYDSLAIMVTDKEMGGELRTASSLSGGETFLVSLALALGLASLNDDNLRIDVLFIDEGFGTLDADSLEMAVNALENMQKFGKKVGIISHVESLKERIPAQIRCNRIGKVASTVEMVNINL